jgi:hypothetical protein
MPNCPECQGALTFVCSWTFRGLWGYDEVLTFECPVHGPIFINPRTPTEQRSEERAVTAPGSNGDHDSLVAAPRRPTPTFNTDAIAVPEPVEPDEPIEPFEP